MAEVKLRWDQERARKARRENNDMDREQFKRDYGVYPKVCPDCGNLSAIWSGHLCICMHEWCINAHC